MVDSLPAGLVYCNAPRAKGNREGGPGPVVISSERSESKNLVVVPNSEISPLAVAVRRLGRNDT